MKQADNGAAPPRLIGNRVSSRTARPSDTSTTSPINEGTLCDATPNPGARLRDGGLARTDVRLDRQRVVLLPVHPSLICIEFRPTALKIHRNISKEQVS